VHGVNHGFLEQYFLANVWHRFMTRNGDTGARSDRFAIKDSVFVTMPILIPSVAEQQHIASSLQTLDGLIAAAQSKLVGYRQLKKSLLQELFV
jgi:type I restriction enzyme S subunit